MGLKLLKAIKSWVEPHFYASCTFGKGSHMLLFNK